MTTPATRFEWVIFLALGFMWGSSYLFIKLAVDSFGTFTLVALRLLIGAAFLWSVMRVTRTPLPRDRRVYGHLIVMSIINITIPFALITWAEQSVDSALAAILNSTVPLFVIVLAPIFLPDEPIRINGILGLMIGFVGVVLIVSPGLAAAAGTVPGMVALLGSSFSYAIGNVYARRNIQGQPPMIPAVFQVTFALLIVGTLAIVVERPWATATPEPRMPSHRIENTAWASGRAVHGCSSTMAGTPTMTAANVTWNTAGIIGGTPRTLRREYTAPAA